MSVQVESKSDRLIDSIELFQRESRDSLFDQDFRQSGNIIQIRDTTSRHTVTTIQQDFNGNISNRTSDRRHRNRSTYPIGRIAA